MKLSKTQKQIVELLSEGFTQKEISKQLNKSPNTICTHLLRARGANGCRTVAELIGEYVSNKLTPNKT